MSDSGWICPVGPLFGPWYITGIYWSLGKGSTVRVHGLDCAQDITLRAGPTCADITYLASCS